MTDFAKCIVLIYLLSALNVVFTKYNSKKIGNFISIILAGIAFTMAALRPNDFPDYEQYQEIFRVAASGDFHNLEYWSSHGEPGFKILSFGLSTIGLDSLGLMIFMSSLSFFLLLIISKITKVGFSYLWFAYFSIFFITRDFGAIRLGIASHLIVISILQKNVIRRLSLGAVASFSFQYFSIIPLLFNFFSKINIKLNTILFIVFLSTVLGIFINFENIKDLVPIKQLENYENTNHIMVGYSNVILPLLRNFIFLSILYLYACKYKIDSDYNILLWFSFFSTMSYVAFSGVLILAYRFSAYFGAVIPVAFAIVLNDGDLNKRKFLLICVFLTFNFIIGFYYNDFIWNFN